MKNYIITDGDSNTLTEGVQGYAAASAMAFGMARELGESVWLHEDTDDDIEDEGSGEEHAAPCWACAEQDLSEAVGADVECDHHSDGECRWDRTSCRGHGISVRQIDVCLCGRDRITDTHQRCDECCDDGITIVTYGDSAED